MIKFDNLSWFWKKNIFDDWMIEINLLPDDLMIEKFLFRKSDLWVDSLIDCEMIDDFWYLNDILNKKYCLYLTDWKINYLTSWMI
jgi:hypothetical protein